MKSAIKTVSVIAVFIVFLLLNGSAYPSEGSAGVPLESKPRGIAINFITDIAVVSNENSDSVSIIEISNQSVLASISVGKAPRGVAVNGGSNIALASNTKDNTVTVIDLETYSIIRTIIVGREPEGIAVNPFTMTAVVTNHQDNTISVVDLETLAVIKTVPVGKEPNDAAIDPELNIALVVNEKDCDISVVDLNTLKVTNTIPVGQKPKAIDINPERHLAVVVNEKDDSITIIDLKTWHTDIISIGKHPIDVAVNPLDNRALVICDEDRRLQLIDLDTRVVIGSYSINKLPRGVAVNNFTNIAMVADDKTDSLTLIQLPNPIPEITSVAPANAGRGSANLTINIEGNKFITSSAVYFANQILTVGFKDNHHITVAVPSAMFLKAGIFPITLNNPSPEGGTSCGVDFAVNNPVPTITVLDPAEAIAGSQDLTFNVYGTGFFDDTEIYFGGLKRSTTYKSSTRLQSELISQELKLPKLYDVMAYNASPGGGSSNKMTFTVKSPIEIEITSPADGQTINQAKVMIKGTFKSEINDVGITVNGIMAEMIGNEWIANDVPLAVGTNTITATVKDSFGNSANATIIVRTSDITQQVRLSANITSGVAPLTTYFTVSISTFTPVSYKIDFDGDSIIDYTDSSFDNLSHTYTTEGIFYPTITVTDAQGNTYSDTIAINVLSKTEIDTLLRSKWEGMKGTLKNKDTEGALKYFVERSKERYRSIFEAIKDQLPGILNTFVEFNITDVYENLAEYELVADENGVLYSYPGVLMRDASGLWKFKDF